MNPHDEPFVPETVEEQIEQSLQKPRQQEQDLSSEMVQTLQSIYTEDSQLQHLWDRLQQAKPRTTLATGPGHSVADEPLAPTISSSLKELPQGTIGQMQIHKNYTKKHNTSRRVWGLLAAAILVTVLIGSMLTVLHLAHPGTSNQPGITKTVQSVPTTVPTVLPARTPTGVPTTTACPASGQGRTAVMPPVSLEAAPAIVYIDPTAAILKLYSTQSHQTTTILNQAGTISSAQLSGDGQWILYVLVTQNTSAIQLIRVDGKYQQTLYCAPVGTTLSGKTSLQWSPNQKLLIFEQTNPNSQKTPTLELLNLSTGKVQVELAPNNNPIQNVFEPRTWLDNTRVYVTTGPANDEYPATLQILDTSKGAQQTPDDLQLVLGVSDEPWDFDSTYDGSKLFVVHADPATGRSGPGTYCQITGSNGLIFNSTTLTPNQLRVAGYGSSTLLLSVNRASDPADKYNGLWKLNADGTGLVQLTAQPNQFNEFSQYPWSNVSRDGQSYAYGSSYGSLNGGALTPYTSSSALLVGWTTM